MNSALRFIRASIVSAPLVLALSCACPKVYLPASDSTPPTIAWKVTNIATGAVQTGTGNDTLTAKYNQYVDVKMTAADSGGVYEAYLVTSYPDFGVVDLKSEKHDAWPSGQVCSKIVIIQEIFIPDWALIPSIVLNGVGKNFHGGVTTAKLNLTFTP